MAFEDGGVRSLTCLDCNTSAKFISPDGEAYFKLTHAGHRVVEGGKTGAFSAPEGGAGGPDAARSATRRNGSFESMFGEAAEAPAEEPSTPETDEAAPGESDAEPQEERPRKGKRAKRKAETSRPPAGPVRQPARTPQMLGHGDLLLARTSFIESTEGAEVEVQRVSKALAKLRWNITPPYTVSMMFSDILCITSDSPSIGKEVVDLVEALGYTFSGFEANNSRPLAWFKKKEEEEKKEEGDIKKEAGSPTEEAPPVPEAPVQPDATELDELAQTIRDQGAQIEKEMAQIDEERRMVAERLKALSPEGEQGQQ